GCGCEERRKGEGEKREDCVKQILWQKIVVAAWRDRYELTHQNARAHDSNEHTDDNCGYPRETGAAQPKGSVDSEDAAGKIGAGEQPNGDAGDRSVGVNNHNPG